MTLRPHACRTLFVAALTTVLLAGLSQARAQTGSGFAIGRYVPTAAGEPTFMIDHPWYSSMRYFAGGITLDYGHNPLVLGTRSGGTFTQTNAVIAHQLMMHVDLAGSFLDRVLVMASLPIVLYEKGSSYAGVGPAGAGVGDPQIGAMVRLWGQPYKDPFSIHLGVRLWIPVGTNDSHAGESGVRVLPKVAMGGLALKHLFWSFTAGFLYRPEASIGTVAAGSGNTVGSEFQFGGAIGYADMKRRFTIAPEVQVASVVINGKFFNKNYASLEALLGATYNIARQVQIGAAVGTAFLREPGTPDARALIRIAYAPMPKEKEAPKPLPPADRDEDGIADPQDACPAVRGEPSFDPKKNGCPPDKDGDGVYDLDDVCPETPAGDKPDPDRKGCPFADEDKDGVHDKEDLCPTVPMGDMPDPDKKGCPLVDTDKDGVFDPEDECKTVPAGAKPDPKKKGCPLADRDDDSIVDDVDACPDKAGAPNPDPKKHGCPGLVTVRKGMIQITKQVFFATGKDTILPNSFAILQAVADAINASPDIKKVAIEGHTDNVGKPDYNRELSQRRTESVRKWLVEHGVAADKLAAQGYGPDKPIAPNTTAKGRAKNRRVDFRITDPAAPGFEAPAPASAAPPSP